MMVLNIYHPLYLNMDTSLPNIVVVVVSHPIQRYKTQYCKNVFKFIYFREILSSPRFLVGFVLINFLILFVVCFVFCLFRVTLDCHWIVLRISLTFIYTFFATYSWLVSEAKCFTQYYICYQLRH